MDISMTRRRFLAQTGKAALATGIGGALLEACGTTSSSSSGPVTLTYGWWSNGPTKDNAMLAWVKEFEKTQPNIKIKAEILSWPSYWTKLQTTTAGGNAYDIIGMASSQAGTYMDEGAMYDLSTFSGYQDAIKNLRQTDLTLCSWKGKQYSLPVGIYVPLVGYNKDMLKQAGIPFPDPVTPMEFSAFKTMAQKLVKKVNGKYTQYAINVNDLGPLYASFTAMRGGQFYDNPVNPTKVLATTPEAIQGLADYQSLFTENLNPPYAEMATGAWGTGDTDSLITGKIAFARMGAFDFADIISKNQQDKIGAMPLFSINGKQVTIGNANSFGIFKGSKNPQQAWEFLKWAVQTGPDTTYAKLSDVPSDITAFSQMSTYLTPQVYVPTLTSATKGFQTDVITPHLQYGTDLLTVITDLTNGKLTPEKAGQQLVQKGNVDLA
ncbi:MAG: sugar ABC transporter substrate-binding protein [Ktedonobacteraceae bacterium]|nr:sugar ABC transporter substrate-binding protein [Ktedonobacteraceae bacterium]